MPTKVITVSPETNKAREDFFRTVFQEETGYVCLATKGKLGFTEEFFLYPKELPLILEYINRNYHGQDFYFCSQLLQEKKRTKAHVKVCTNAWSDLDECDPTLLDPPPTIVVQSSPGRYQGYWVLDKATTPIDAEEVSHRIAKAYEAFGVDQSGWDLTQLLRVPLTYNQKRFARGVVPSVEVIVNTGLKYSLERLRKHPPVPGYEWTDEPMPTELDDPDDLLLTFKDKLSNQVTVLYNTPPQGDWSGALWSLECLLLEGGMTKEETFAVANSAACNKFRRDGLSPEYLWKDVCRAASRIQLRIAESTSHKPPPPLLSEDEREMVVQAPASFVEDYVAWAKSRGDAAWQYHEAGAYVILSQLLSGVVKLPTSFGVMVPNLWFMILADTTLTRKSTAMDIAVEMLLQVDPDAVLATDGSLEGLMSGIAARPNRPGIFLRDEFSGLLEMIRKKDYYAGMVESLTKLYDGKYQKRMLRKEIIEIRDPILIFFCGGIKTRVLAQLDTEFVLSGFMPRFIFIEAQSDISNYRPIGPMTSSQDTERDILVARLQKMKETYDQDMVIHVGEQTVTTRRTWDAVLAPEVWDRYNTFEMSMVQFGVESNTPETLTPTLDRLSKSTLKASVLLAAERQEPTEYVHVEMIDLLRAISYCEKWREFTLDVAANVGKNAPERQLDLLTTAISREPGIFRSKLMQNYHLNAREAEFALETLEQRGVIRRAKNGRAERLYPIIAR